MFTDYIIIFIYINDYKRMIIEILTQLSSTVNK